MISNADERGVYFKCDGRPTSKDIFKRTGMVLKEHLGLPPNRNSTVFVHDCDTDTNIFRLLGVYKLVEIVESALGRLFV